MPSKGMAAPSTSLRSSRTRKYVVVSPEDDVDDILSGITFPGPVGKAEGGPYGWFTGASGVPGLRKKRMRSVALVKVCPTLSLMGRVKVMRTESSGFAGSETETMRGMLMSLTAVVKARKLLNSEARFGRTATTPKSPGMAERKLPACPVPPHPLIWAGLQDLDLPKRHGFDRLYR